MMSQEPIAKRSGPPRSDRPSPSTSIGPGPFRLRPPWLMAIALAAIISGVALGALPFALSASPPQRPQLAREAAMLHAWNDMVQSFNAQTPMIEELQQSLKADPPRRVRSARRLELYEQIIREQKRQLHDYEIMQREEAR